MPYPLLSFQPRHWAVALLVISWLAGTDTTRAQTRAWQWATQTTHAVANSISSQRISTDAQGNSYVIGDISPSSSVVATYTFGSTTLTGPAPGQDIGYLAKMSPAGQWLWAVAFVGNAFPLDVATDAAGNVYVDGAFSGSTMMVGGASLARTGIGANTFVGRFSPAGQCQWLRGANPTGTGGADDGVYGVALAVDPTTGNVVVGGAIESTSAVFGSVALSMPAGQTTAGFVARLSPAGQWLSAVVAGTSNDQAYVEHLKVGAQGQVVISGEYESNVTVGTTTYPGDGAYLAQLSPSNTWQWSTVATGAFEYGVHIALETNGTVVAAGGAETGSRLGSVTVPATVTNVPFVSRLSGSGQWLSTTLASFSGTPSLPPNGYIVSMTLDAAGGAVVLGEFEGAGLRLGSTTLAALSGMPTHFMARFGANGQWDWATGIPLNVNGRNFISLDDAALDAAGNLLVTGEFEGSVTLGSTTLTSTDQDLFVARYTNAGVLSRRRPALAALGVWPNPAAHGTAAQLRLPSALAAPTAVVLFDALGREIRRISLPAGATGVALPTQGLAAGLYRLRCATFTGQLLIEP